MRLLIALAALVSVATAQDCDAQLAAKRSCMRELVAAKRQRFQTEVKPQLEACFVEAGCENPGPVIQEAKQCKEAVLREQVVPALQGCEALSDLEADDLVGFMKLLKIKGRRHHRGGKGKAGKAAKLAQAFCPNEEAVQKALECARGVFPQGKHGQEDSSEEGDASDEDADSSEEDESPFFTESRWAERRQRLQCQLTVQDYVCFQQRKEARKGLCECADSVELDEAAVKEALQQCKPAQLQGLDEEGEEDGEGFKALGLVKAKLCGKGKGAGGFGGRGGFGGGFGGRRGWRFGGRGRRGGWRG